MSEFSFQKGYKQVPIGKAVEVKAELMQVFGVTSLPAWLRRLRGEVCPRVDDARKVEKVFEKYGITDVWGD